MGSQRPSIIDPSLSTQPIRAVTPSQGRPRVLIVDDALVVRTQMQSLLQLHHVDAILATNAEQALAGNATPKLCHDLSRCRDAWHGWLCSMSSYETIDRNVPIVDAYRQGLSIRQDSRRDGWLQPLPHQADRHGRIEQGG